MNGFSQTLSAFDALLAPHGYRLSATNVHVEFTRPMFAHTLFAIPDVHLCDASGGDIFLAGNPEKPKRLRAVLRALLDYQLQHPLSSQAVQLGDWFDIWRVSGENPRHMEYGQIQNAAVYQDILDLDAQLGLAHVIGNHDCAFLNSLPTRRVAQPQFFRLGFWLSRSVYTLHGHQSDLVPPRGTSFEQAALALATCVGRFLPGTTRFEQYVDHQGFVQGTVDWLLGLLLNSRDDPPRQPRALDTRTPPPVVRSGLFLQREYSDVLARLLQQIAALPEAGGRSAEVLIVGHSHAPCAAWTETALPDKPLFIVDAGGWAYEQSNLLIAAEDTVAVFNVVPS